MKRFRLNDKRILVVLVLIVVVVMMMDFNNRMSEYLRLNAQKDTLSTRVTELASTKESIQTQIAFATSDAAVIQWARQEAHMLLPGDVPIVAIPPAGVTPVPTQVPMPTYAPVSNWEVWYALFFGEK